MIPFEPDVSPDAPIGIFDSGFGGLTVARAVVDQLPQEDIIYLGDTARAPYGSRPIAEVREYALQSLDKLASHGVKALVIACNTASAAVLRDARERYNVPIVEVILPAARRAAQISRNNSVGVICTQATATSNSYDDAMAVASQVTLTTVACPRFVDFVEAGVTSGDELLTVARGYLAEMHRANVDTLILGCTHYPLLSGVISYVMGEHVTLVSSATTCGDATWAALKRRELLRTGTRTAERLFLTTGNPGHFEGIGGRLSNGLVDDVQQIRLPSL